MSHPTTWNRHGVLNLLQNLMWSTYCKRTQQLKVLLANLAVSVLVYKTRSALWLVSDFETREAETEPEQLRVTFFFFPCNKMLPLVRTLFTDSPFLWVFSSWRSLHRSSGTWDRSRRAPESKQNVTQGAAATRRCGLDEPLSILAGLNKSCPTLMFLKWNGSLQYLQLSVLSGHSRSLWRSCSLKRICSLQEGQGMIMNSHLPSWFICKKEKKSGAEVVTTVSVVCCTSWQNVGKWVDRQRKNCTFTPSYKQ